MSSWGDPGEAWDLIALSKDDMTQIVTWEVWSADVQERAGISDERMREIYNDARQAFKSGISAATYADLST